MHSENKYYYTESIKINKNVLQINTYCKDRNDFNLIQRKQMDDRYRRSDWWKGDGGLLVCEG